MTSGIHVTSCACKVEVWPTKVFQGKPNVWSIGVCNYITWRWLHDLDNINNRTTLDIRIMPEQLTYDTATNKLYKLSTYAAKGTLLPSPPISLTLSLSILVSTVSYHMHVLMRYIRFLFWASARKPQSSVEQPPAALPLFFWTLISLSHPTYSCLWVHWITPGKTLLSSLISEFRSHPILTMPHCLVNVSHPFHLVHSGDTSV